MRKYGSNGLRLAGFQAKVFEASRNKCACSSPIFLRRFLMSDVLQTLDKNESSLIRWTVNEALEEIELEFGPSNYGTEKYNGGALFWMGYIYRYISYTRDINTRLLFKLFKGKQLYGLFPVYHTQDPEWCIKNLLELNCQSEDIFDKDWRLKRAMCEKSGPYNPAGQPMRVVNK
ncbi:MAG: hypothetical protein LKF58_03240 [Bacilli bacterium]|jgi:hypothetical protein|nr:hypothetical protein [Bacilli bacterium]